MEQDNSHAVDYRRVQHSEEFTQLRRKHRSFVLPVSIAFLVWYFLYVLLGAYAHEFMARPVLGNINLGVVLGLAQFVTTFAITMAYVSYANRRLDPLAAELREDLEQTEAGAAGSRKSDSGAGPRKPDSANGPGDGKEPQ